MNRYLVLMSICIIAGFLLLGRNTSYSVEENKISKQTVTTNNISKNEEIDITNSKERTLAEIALANGDKAKLIYNGDVHLRVNAEDIVVNSIVNEEMLFNNTLPNVQFTLEQIIDNKLLSVTEYNPGMKYIEVIQKIYEINTDGLSELWTSAEIDFELIKVDKDVLEIGCSIISDPIKLELTEKERQEVSKDLKSLEEAGVLVDSIWTEVKDNFLCGSTGCNWLDIEGDGSNEMILSIYCYTVGALTPIHLREKGVMIFNVGDNIELRDIIFERDNKDDRLVPYFIGER